MISKTVQVFDDQEEEFVKLLIAIGTKRTVAQVLVFLSRNPESTTRDIERGTDLRQPEVSTAIRFMTEQGWLKCWETKAEGKGRPMKMYDLAKPLGRIMDGIGHEMKQETDHQLSLIRKLKKLT